MSTTSLHHHGGGEPLPAHDPVLWKAPGGRRGTRVLLYAATIGSMLLSVSLGPGIAPVDLVVAAVIVLGASRLGSSGPEVRRLLRASLPWIWLVLLGSTLALLGLGVQRWAVDGLLRDAFVVAFFFTACELASDSRVRYSSLMTCTLVSLLLVEAAIFSEAGSYRPRGTFDNPSYAGHFLVLGLLLLLRTSRFPFLVKALVCAITAVALFLTGSFGSIAMLAAGVAYLLWARLGKERRVLARTGYGLLLALAVSAAAYFSQVVIAPTFYLSTSVNAERIDRSAGSRFELWAQGLSMLRDNPLGVGPTGLANRDLLGRFVEIHNDYLAYLVERGPLGLVGLLGFGVVLWRFGGRRGSTRLLLIAATVGMLTRETMHFRHMWLFLAFAVAYDVRTRRVGAT